MAVDQPPPTRHDSRRWCGHRSEDPPNEEPAALTIGWTTTPGWSMGTSRNEMVVPFRSAGTVRASRKIQLAVVPADVQILWPLIAPIVTVEHPLVRNREARSGRLRLGRSPGTTDAR